MGMAALLTCFALAVLPPTGGVAALLACPEVWQLCRKKSGGNPRLIFLALLSELRLRFG